MRDAVLMSKERWVRQGASRVHKMNFFPKEAWKAINTLRDGNSTHHVDHKLIMFIIVNRALTKTEIMWPMDLRDISRIFTT